MERLTKREGKHTVRIGNEWRRHDPVWDKLAYYEDLEEQGRLIIDGERRNPKLTLQDLYELNKFDNRKYDCVFCVYYGKCDLEQQKDHGYNLRDGTDDCFVPHGKPVAPWLNPFTECYGCRKHSYENCSECRK